MINPDILKRRGAIPNTGHTIVANSGDPGIVILTAPHDGVIGQKHFGFPLEPRRNGIMNRDLRTGEIVESILAKSNLPMEAVRGDIWRGLIDYNRHLRKALEDRRLRRFYTGYHQALSQLVGKAVGFYGVAKCLVLDIHGFIQQPQYAPNEGYDLILGTRYRETIPHGNPDQQMGEFLRGKGYKVFIPEDRPVNPNGGDDLFPGNFTVGHYSESFDVNAIQVEIDRRFRLDSNQRDRLCQDLSDCVRVIIGD